jgi:hypothetical protein
MDGCVRQPFCDESGVGLGAFLAWFAVQPVFNHEICEPREKMPSAMRPFFSRSLPTATKRHRFQRF